MTAKSLVRAAIWFLLLAPLVVMSTPPSISWDIFDVDGTLAHAGGSPGNYTVSLVHRGYCGGNVKQWCRIANCDIEDVVPYGPYAPLALTAADGRFSLRIAACEYYANDTLAVAVVLPDTMLIGDSFAVSDLQYTPIMETGHREDQGFFCDGDEDFEYERARIYRQPAATVSVP